MLAQWGVWVRSLPDGDRASAVEAWHERAAIMQYDGGATRAQADRWAAVDVMLGWRLTDSL